MPITARNLRKSFNKRVVLDDISLEIQRGEKTVFVGRNGSGKTTLIRCILGLYNYEGSLDVEGTDPRRNRVEILRRLGYVPQTPPPLNMKVKDLIRYAADVSNKRTDRIIEIAKTLKLDKEEDFNKNFVKLSGGMKQKLLIALAMGRENGIIIMDEPTSNLDPGSREIFCELLANSPADTTFILTSHRADELSFFANRAIELDYGKLIRDTATA